jgi:hypothetical protein
MRHHLFTLTLVVVAALTLATGSAWAGAATTGKVTLETMSVAAGLGGTWGQGVLEYQGQRYPFTVGGFSIVDVGVAKVVWNGDVYNLKSVEEFEGMFIAGVAGGTLGGGVGGGAMVNQNEVSMVWTSTSVGLNFSLAQAGLSFKFTPEARQAMRSRQPSASPR